MPKKNQESSNHLLFARFDTTFPPFSLSSSLQIGMAHISGEDKVAIEAAREAAEEAAYPSEVHPRDDERPKHQGAGEPPLKRLRALRNAAEEKDGMERVLEGEVRDGGVVPEGEGRV